ncbi:hypothetical protein ACIRG4_19090 [Streptomyces sp. NPDC102395]|uniref:hypothetical protein n=1 Tax=Streptomyces sp. NPDC102395 TaxID=3366168 RepID=UPI00380655F4
MTACPVLGPGGRPAGLTVTAVPAPETGPTLAGPAFCAAPTLTQRWGSRRTTRGKTIWCEQTLPPPF